MDGSVLCYYLEATVLIGVKGISLEGEGKKSAWLQKGSMEN